MEQGMGKFRYLPGSVAFRQWVHKQDLSHSQIAALLHTTVTALNQWLTGHSRPRLIHRMALSMLCGIEVGDWDTKEEQEELDAIVQDIAQVRALQEDTTALHAIAAGLR